VDSGCPPPAPPEAPLSRPPHAQRGLGIGRECMERHQERPKPRGRLIQDDGPMGVARHGSSPSDPPWPGKTQGLCNEDSVKGVMQKGRTCPGPPPGSTGARGAPPPCGDPCQRGYLGHLNTHPSASTSSAPASEATVDDELSQPRNREGDNSLETCRREGWGGYARMAWGSRCPSLSWMVTQVPPSGPFAEI
jgi:hypothetical protein